MTIPDSNFPPNFSKAKSKMGWSWSECGVNKMWRAGRRVGGRPGYNWSDSITALQFPPPCFHFCVPSAWNAFLSP